MVKTRSIFLYPFSILYGFFTGVRNFLYNAEIIKSSEFSIPVICVGNLSAGGTGKTPHTEYLIELLQKSFNVAVLSRGYRRKSSGFLIADSDSTVSDIGDEPLQVSRKYPGVIVAVDRKRVHGVEEIMKTYPGTSVIILDDGYQHRRITPGISILLSDFDNLMINDHMLPYGNLRETSHNRNRADIILITKAPENISPIQRRIIVRDINKKPYQNLYFTSLSYREPIPVFENMGINEDPFSSGQVSDRGFLIVTGIANPAPLAEYLGKRADEIIHLSFGDHHNFTMNDIEKINNAYNTLKAPHKYIITTEKDSVRLREFINIAEPIRSAFFYIPIGIWFLNDDKDEFNNLIVDYVRKNKRNNKIS
ncbi:MAG TPA: tetraacyldisaccharide 4'-kinase [Bacteroidales bacterium]|nr:tetraacyldisaccharide 4'-kinase [Bacteroidales bacterium]